MNIALVLQHKLVLGLQRLWGEPGHSPSAHSMRPQPMAVARSHSGIHLPKDRSARPAFATDLAIPAARPVAVMPLRVVRVVEKGQPRSSTGRMVISGRMADVCAELDRLVAHEAALH